MIIAADCQVALLTRHPIHLVMNRNYCILLLLRNLLFKSNKIGIIITGNNTEALISYTETIIEIV